MLSSFQRSLLTLLFSFLLFGCGYRFYSHPSYAKAKSKIFIPPWENPSSESEFGAILAEDLRKELSTGGFFIPVWSASSADFVLKGKINHVYLVPVGYLSFSQVTAIKVDFFGSYELIDKKTGKVILERSISRYVIYKTTQVNPEEVELAKKQALERLAQEVSEIIFHQLMF